MESSSPAPNVAWILGQPGFPVTTADDQVALLWGESRRTYGELRSRAQGLAQALGQAHGGVGLKVAVLRVFTGPGSRNLCHGKIHRREDEGLAYGIGFVRLVDFAFG